jgi:hypothetical protein
VGGFASDGVMASTSGGLTNRKSEFRFVKFTPGKVIRSYHLQIHLLTVLMALVTGLRRLNRGWREFALNPAIP